MADQRRAGIITVQIDGEIMDAKGEFTYNLGQPKRTAIVGIDRVHGYKDEPQVAFVEGKITDRKGLDLSKLVNKTGVTVTLQLAVGKMFVLKDAWYASEGTVTTNEAEVAVRFEGILGEEIAA